MSINWKETSPWNNLYNEASMNCSLIIMFIASHSKTKLQWSMDNHQNFKLHFFYYSLIEFKVRLNVCNWAGVAQSV
jgi:hypothetical protein